MKKKLFEKPTMQVVKLQQTGMLMTSNQNSLTRVQNYGWIDIIEE